MGCIPSKCDPSLFVYSQNSDLVYMLVYVDDIIVTSNNSTLTKSPVSQLHSWFSLVSFGLCLDNFNLVRFRTVSKITVRFTNQI